MKTAPVELTLDENGIVGYALLLMVAILNNDTTGSVDAAKQARLAITMIGLDAYNVMIEKFAAQQVALFAQIPALLDRVEA